MADRITAKELEHIRGPCEHCVDIPPGTPDADGEINALWEAICKLHPTGDDGPDIPLRDCYWNCPYDKHFQIANCRRDCPLRALEAALASRDATLVRGRALPGEWRRIVDARYGCYERENKLQRGWDCGTTDCADQLEAALGEPELEKESS